MTPQICNGDTFLQLQITFTLELRLNFVFIGIAAQTFIMPYPWASPAVLNKGNESFTLHTIVDLCQAKQYYRELSSIIVLLCLQLCSIRLVNTCTKITLKNKHNNMELKKD